LGGIGCRESLQKVPNQSKMDNKNRKEEKRGVSGHISKAERRQQRKRRKLDSPKPDADNAIPFAAIENRLEIRSSL